MNNSSDEWVQEFKNTFQRNLRNEWNRFQKKMIIFLKVVFLVPLCLVLVYQLILAKEKSVLTITVCATLFLGYFLIRLGIFIKKRIEAFQQSKKEAEDAFLWSKWNRFLICYAAMLSSSFVTNEYFAGRRAFKILDKLEKRCRSYKDMAVVEKLKSWNYYSVYNLRGYHMLLKLIPNSGFLIPMRGKAEIEKQILVLRKKVVQKYNTEPEAWNRLACCYERGTIHADEEKKRECYLKALELDPQNHTATWNMIIICEERNEYRKMLEYGIQLQKIAEAGLGKFYPGVYHCMAVGYSYMGDEKLAETFYKKHQEHKNNNPGKLYIMEPDALRKKMEEVWQGYLNEGV